MKTEYLTKWDQVNESPRPTSRAHVAQLLRASRSRRKGNNWRTSKGWWICDAGLTITSRPAWKPSDWIITA